VLSNQAIFRCTRTDLRYRAEKTDDVTVGAALLLVGWVVGSREVMLGKVTRGWGRWAVTHIQVWAHSVSLGYHMCAEKMSHSHRM
jgi:uncharacterized protein (DUF983 family)